MNENVIDSMPTICLDMGYGVYLFTVCFLLFYLFYRDARMTGERMNIIRRMDDNNRVMLDAVDKNTKAVTELRAVITGVAQ